MGSLRLTAKELANLAFFKDNLWEISFDITGYYNPAYNAEENDAKLNFLAQEVNIPFRKLELDYNKAQKRWYPAKYADYDPITIKFIETEDLRVSSFIENWYRTYLNDIGQFRVGIDPRRDFTITYQKFNKSLLKSLLSRAGSLSLGTGANLSSGISPVLSAASNVSLEEIASLAGVSLPDTMFENVCSFKVYGANLQERSEFTMSYEGGTEATTIDVTVTVDYIESTLPDQVSDSDFSI